MKDINYVIQEVVKRTGKSEEQVAAVIRSAVADTRDFMESKKGFAIYWPRFGTFSFRVTAIKPYVERQRRFMAYWLYRLDVGRDRFNDRTIQAAEQNIAIYTKKIENTLIVKQEFLTDHAKYYRWKAGIVAADADTDITRLGELLNVADLKKGFEEKYKGKACLMQELPSERELLDDQDDEEDDDQD